MSEPQSTGSKQTKRSRVFALVMIVCGVFATLLSFADTYDSATRPLNVVGSVFTGDPQFMESVQPGPEEWPLAAAKMDHYTGFEKRSDRYTVEITPVRGTVILRLDVIGRSPTRTTAFGAWLTKHFAHDLFDSFSNRGYTPTWINGRDSLVSQAPGPAIPLRLHPGKLLLSLLTPLLLLASGIVLWRVSKPSALTI